jgi:hypothetical protein
LLVLLSAKRGNEVARLFKLNNNKRRERYDINYNLLKKGDPDESRFVIGKVIMDTLTTETTPNLKIKGLMRNQNSNGSIHNLRVLFDD